MPAAATFSGASSDLAERPRGRRLGAPPRAWACSRRSSAASVKAVRAPKNHRGLAMNRCINAHRPGSHARTVSRTPRRASSSSARPEPADCVHRGGQLLLREGDRGHRVLQAAAEARHPAVGEDRLPAHVDRAAEVPVGDLGAGRPRARAGAPRGGRGVVRQQERGGHVEPARPAGARVPAVARSRRPPPWKRVVSARWRRAWPCSSGRPRWSGSRRRTR